MRTRLNSIVSSVLTEPMLRNLFFLCLITVTVFPIYNLFFVYPSFTGFLVSNVESDAIRTVEFLSSKIIFHPDKSVDNSIDAGFIDKINMVKDSFQLEKLKILSESGRVVYSTNNDEIGNQYGKDDFFETVAWAHIYSKMVDKGSQTLDGKVPSYDQIEVYVPIMEGNSFLGAFEIYYNITEKRKTLDLLVFNLSTSLFAISFVLFLITLVVMVKAGFLNLDQKQSESRLKQAYADLDNRVSERTRELSTINQELLLEIAVRKKTEIMLTTAKNQAVEANEAKSDFLASMSHELRTPMHGILGFASFGLDKLQQEKSTDPATLHDYFLEIQSSGNRLLALINDLLDLAKLEAGKLKYIFEKVPLSDLIDSIIKESAALVSEKQLEIDFQSPRFEDSAVMDSNRIMQVIRNLLSNAIKFSKSGGVITIAIHNQEDNLELSVSDRGMGIPDEELGAVFEKFIQSSRTDTGEGGTGLGLPISRQIISDHGGKIWAENNPLGGAKFTVIIPKRREITKKLGEILVEKKFITREILQQTLDEQDQSE